MKKIMNILFTILVGVISFFGITSNVLADAPKTFKTKEPVILEDYIEGAPKVHFKELENGVWVYCQNEVLVYQGGYTMKVHSKIDEGYIYILENKPNTGDKNKDYYAMQIAIWWYEDLLNNNNANLSKEVKTNILKQVNTDKYIRIIYNLVNGAKNYKQNKDINISFNEETTKFNLVSGYYVSEEIELTYTGENVTIKLNNAPANTKVIDKQTKNGKVTFKIQIPESSIENGKTITLNLEATVNKNIKKVYNYFYSEEWQKIVYGEIFTDEVTKNASKTLSLTTNVKEYEIKISKTDITGDKEIPGATLNLKGDNNTNLTWISTNESHKVTLKPGYYSLTETIAPKGYILSKETIEFKLDETGTLYQKNAGGEYTKVDRIKMINEVKPTINISKLDSKTNNYVSGATLNIKNNKGEVIASYITTNESKYIALDEGYYTLEETNAPDGYNLNTTPIEFKVDADGNLYVKNTSGEYEKANGIILYNEPVEVIVPNVPKTDLSSTITYIIGFITLASGAIILIKSGKKC